MVKDTISFPDFAKLDLRVGRVVSAENIEGSEKLIRLKVDLGQEIGEKQILAGLLKWYKPEDFVGKKFIVVANLEAKKMMGEESQGMILCVDVEGKAPYLIEVDKSIPEGTVIR